MAQSNIEHYAYFNDVVYVTGCSGTLPNDLLSREIINPLIVICLENSGVITVKLINELSEINARFTEQFIVVSQMFYETMGVGLTIEAGVVGSMKSEIIKYLFEVLTQAENKSSALLTIAIFLNVKEDKNENILNEIKRRIHINHLNSSYGLEELSAELYMSKRKIQSILRLHGTSFRLLLKDRKSKTLRLLINSEPNSTLKTLSYKAGFKSPSSANKFFCEIFGISPFEYKKEVKIKS
ncbi:helix-turn-helix transcriptional regulator [Vibrio mimicus]